MRLSVSWCAQSRDSKATFNYNLMQTWHYTFGPHAPQTQVLCGFLNRPTAATVEDGFDDLALDPKLQPGFARCRLYRDRARDRDLAAVVDHPFDVIHEKLPLRVEGQGRLKAHVRVRAELPDARVHKVFMLRRS